MRDEGSERREPRDVAALDAAERDALAALAVLAPVAVAPRRLAELAGVDGGEAAVASLERRGLVVGDDRGRVAVPPVLVERLRATMDLDGRAALLLRRLAAAAEEQPLSRDDVAAFVALADSAADPGALRQVLRVAHLAATRSGAVSAECVPLFSCAVEAGRRLGDHDAEAWALEQLAASAAGAGAAADAEALLRQARRLRRARRGDRARGVRSAFWAIADPVAPAARIATRAAMLAAVAAAGLLVGMLTLDDDDARADAPTFTIVETVVATDTVYVTTTVATVRTVRTRRGGVTFTTGAATTVTVPTLVTTTIRAAPVTATRTETLATTVVVPTTATVAPTPP